MSWEQRAVEAIATLDSMLPADMPLKDRRHVLDGAGIMFHQGASWGKKAWAKAKRKYLERHGQNPGYGRPLADAPLFDQKSGVK